MSGYYIGVGVRAKAISLSKLIRDESDAKASANVEDGPRGRGRADIYSLFCFFFLLQPYN